MCFVRLRFLDYQVIVDKNNSSYLAIRFLESKWVQQKAFMDKTTFHKSLSKRP